MLIFCECLLKTLWILFVSIRRSVRLRRADLVIGCSNLVKNLKQLLTVADPDRQPYTGFLNSEVTLFCKL